MRVATAPSIGSDSPLADPVVAEAVRSLSVQQRAVVYHTSWEDLTVPAVAEVIGTGEGSVKRQLATARARLGKALR